MATPKQSRKQAQLKAKQHAIARQQVVRLEAEASEKRINDLAQQQLKKMVAAREKEMAKQRAEEEFRKISRQSKGLTKKKGGKR